MPDHQLFFIESLDELYTAVQAESIFPDSKYFVDCTPKEDPRYILEVYRKEKTHTGFDLKEFVTSHFILPPETTTGYHSDKKPILKHLDELWTELTRQPASAKGDTLIPLPSPYVVPGGRFREIYYWDSYFTVLGLQVSRRIELIQHMVDNFAFLIDSIGHIPNGNRTYYLSRSQPPFFTLMVEILAEEKGTAVLLKYLPQIEKEYAFWMDGSGKLNIIDNAHRRVVLLPGGEIMNRYWDDKDVARPEAYREDSHIADDAGSSNKMIHRHIRAACESGWDFSSRWFSNGQDMHTIQTAYIVPVDLNCLLLHTEEILLSIYSLTNKNDLAETFNDKVKARKKAIQQYCWNEEAGFYFDYQFIDHAATKQFTLAAMYPLFFSIATKEQAAKTAELVEEKFLQPGGLLTTIHQSGQQWDAPNGWAPLQWMAYKGLKNYGHHQLAGEIKKRWMRINETVYNSTGKMMEKYDVAGAEGKAGGGEYPNQDGFGWTNGVYLKFSRES